MSDAIPEELRNQYNRWLHAIKIACSPPGTKTVPTAAQTVPENPQILPVAASLQTSQDSTTPPNPNSPLPPPTQDPGSIVAINSMEGGGGGTPRDRHLMWCINLGSKTKASCLKISDADDDFTIFQKLKNEYWKVRSWRMVFSLYIISEIKFVKVYKSYFCFWSRTFMPFSNEYKHCSSGTSGINTRFPIKNRHSLCPPMTTMIIMNISPTLQEKSHQSHPSS